MGCSRSFTHTGGSQPKRARNEDFPAQSSYHMSGLRVVALVVVFLGVTLSMLASFVFLFSGALVRLQLPVFLPSLSLIGLAGAGGGMGILLWILLTSILKQHPKRRFPQKQAPLPTATLFATGGMTARPPEPTDRQTGELFSSQRDRWISSEWEGESQRQTEKLAALHMRQRLRTLRLSYADDFSGDDGQKKRDHLKKVHERSTLQRTTDALVEEGVDASWHRP